MSVPAGERSVRSFIEDYGCAWDSFGLAAILGACSTPCFVSRAEGFTGTAREPRRRRREDGSVAFDYRDACPLVRTDDGWTILGDVVL